LHLSIDAPFFQAALIAAPAIWLALTAARRIGRAEPQATRAPEVVALH
jgi:hypothetical protein